MRLSSTDPHLDRGVSRSGKRWEEGEFAPDMPIHPKRLAVLMEAEEKGGAGSWIPYVK
jgi:hypothetical protein